MDRFSKDGAGPASDPLEDFARLYDAEMPRIYRYICYRVRTREEAEDLTADVFCRALRHWPRVRGELRSPRAWLFTLAGHCLVDYYRRVRGRVETSIDDRFGLGDDLAGPEEASIRRQEMQTLLSSLDALPERDRTVLVLRFVGDLSHEEIGEILGISAGASAVALLRALRRLRRLYQEADDG